MILHFGSMFVFLTFSKDKKEEGPFSCDDTATLLMTWKLPFFENWIWNSPSSSFCQDQKQAAGEMHSINADGMQAV